ncbi:calcium homeostasis modulator protein 6 isoform X1 [Gasterosteus aculeatus]
MDKFRTVLDFANKQTNLGFGLVALLTAGGEQVFSSAVFNCPCSDLNFLYGMVFLLVPALALLLLGYILSKKTWKLLTGVCSRRRSARSRWKSLTGTAAALFQISSVALVAPSSWIAVALLNGNYYECAMTGTNVSAFEGLLCGAESSRVSCRQQLHRFPCGTGSDVPKVVRDDVLLALRAQSQSVPCVTTDPGLAAHRLRHVVQPSAQLPGSVHLPHQLPAAQVLGSVHSGGEQPDRFVQRRARQRARREEPEELLRPDPAQRHRHPFQQGLGEDLQPLQVPHQRPILQHPAPVRGERSGERQRYDEDGLHPFQRARRQPPGCSGFCRRRQDGAVTRPPGQQRIVWVGWALDLPTIQGADNLVSTREADLSIGLILTG